MKRTWTRPQRHNENFKKLREGIRKYVERDIKAMNLKAYEERPEKNINLSIGDPTISHAFRYSSM